MHVGDEKNTSSAAKCVLLRDKCDAEDSSWRVSHAVLRRTLLAACGARRVACSEEGKSQTNELYLRQKHNVR